MRKGLTPLQRIQSTYSEICQPSGITKFQIELEGTLFSKLQQFNNKM